MCRRQWFKVFWVLILVLGHGYGWMDVLNVQSRTFSSEPIQVEDTLESQEHWRELSLPMRQSMLLPSPLREQVQLSVQHIEWGRVYVKEMEARLEDMLKSGVYLDYTEKFAFLRKGYRFLTTLEGTEREAARELWDAQVRTAFPYPAEIKPLLRDLALRQRSAQEELEYLAREFGTLELPWEATPLSDLTGSRDLSTEIYPLTRLHLGRNLKEPFRWIEGVYATIWGCSIPETYWLGLRLTPTHLVGPSFERRPWPLTNFGSPTESWNMGEGAILQTQLPIGGWYVDDTTRPVELRNRLKQAAIESRMRTKGPGILLVLGKPVERLGCRLHVSDLTFRYDRLRPTWMGEERLPQFPLLSTRLANLDGGGSFYDLFGEMAKDVDYAAFSVGPYYFLLQQLFAGSLTGEQTWETLVTDTEGFVARHLTQVILADFQAELNILRRERQWQYPVTLYVYY